ncbi:MAG: hypothetical protein U9N61_01610 [Euryarchaeota archaeon]|nr:hypothetical protein [Euryarchaeota archaeon]
MTEIGWRSSAGVGDWVPCEFRAKYKTTLTLNMLKNIDASGFISWVDMGAVHDTIKASIEAVIENDSSNYNLTTFEHHLKNMSVAGVNRETHTPVIRFAESFNPFSFLYKSCTKSGDPLEDNRYEIAITNLPQPKEYNFFSKVLSYKMGIIPNGEILTPADPFPLCYSYSSWYLDGLGMPYPEKQFDGDINSRDKSKQLNAGSYTPGRYGVEFGETTKISVNVNEENARQILLKLKSLRCLSFPITASEKHNIFAHLYPTKTQFRCILEDNEIEVSVKNFRDITITFSIQLLEVIS